ncbi:MAG: hypothetical protein Q8862_04105 [Bacteroidota bacterium]|nr:hypothetical protein [Bacteroidota bacterium]MDP4206021.1 hypothetical protein [Bacteroidota bacterium]
MENPEKGLILENSGTVKLIRILFYLVGAMYVIALIGFYWFKLNNWLIGASVLFALDLLSFAWLNYHYISFSIEKNQFVLRYYSVISLFSRQYHEIEFPLRRLLSYKIRNFLFGIKAELILEIITPKGKAVYPPVNISALTTDQKRILEEEIQNLIIKNHVERN